MADAARFWDSSGTVGTTSECPDALG